MPVDQRDSVPTRIGMMTLGCPKNLVDSEVMLGRLQAGNWIIADTIEESDVAIINTCAFIEDSRQESIDAILELAELKKQGKIKALLVVGCLPQKYHKALDEEIKEIDAMIGTGEIEKIGDVVDRVLKGQKLVEVDNTSFVYDHSAPRFLLTPQHSRYIKVGEGCDHRCSFCIIPELRGDYRSRPISSIVAEARENVANGMQEVNLISQDTSYYGRDIGGEYLLPQLLRSLQEVCDLKWIRLLYNHPFHFTKDILSAMAECSKVCNYVDIPLQHISDRMLKSMKRGIGKESTRKLMHMMRDMIPDLAIRTTFIVGYPGETDQDFRELMDFVSEVGFERLGVFTYSRGDDKAAEFGAQVAEELMTERRDQLMALQQAISLSFHQSWIGRELAVLVDKVNPVSGEATGRAYFDAPDVDGLVRVKPMDKHLQSGQFIKVKIDQALEYDLAGYVI